MAKYKVRSFSILVKDNGGGYDNLYLSCELVNSAGNPLVRKYRIWSDENIKDLGLIEELIEQGLDKAKDDSSSIELTEYLERNYIFLTMPGVNEGQQLKFSAQSLSA